MRAKVIIFFETQNKILIIFLFFNFSLKQNAQPVQPLFYCVAIQEFAGFIARHELSFWRLAVEVVACNLEVAVVEVGISSEGLLAIEVDVVAMHLHELGGSLEIYNLLTGDGVVFELKGGVAIFAHKEAFGVGDVASSSLDATHAFGHGTGWQ